MKQKKAIRIWNQWAWRTQDVSRHIETKLGQRDSQCKRKGALKTRIIKKWSKRAAVEIAYQMRRLDELFVEPTGEGGGGDGK